MGDGGPTLLAGCASSPAALPAPLAAAPARCAAGSSGRTRHPVDAVAQAVAAARLGLALRQRSHLAAASFSDGDERVSVVLEEARDVPLHGTEVVAVWPPAEPGPPPARTYALVCPAARAPQRATGTAGRTLYAADAEATAVRAARARLAEAVAVSVRGEVRQVRTRAAARLARRVRTRVPDRAVELAATARVVRVRRATDATTVAEVVLDPDAEEQP